MTLIGLRSIGKFYGGRAVLRGLEMNLNAGARIGLVGGNGAGSPRCYAYWLARKRCTRGR